MLIYLRRKLHIVDNLRVKIFIKNNIIGPEGIVIDVANKKARINNCSITIDITARLRGDFIRRKIFVKSSVFVSPHSEIMLSIKEINLSNDRDFLFEPAQTNANLTIFAYLINHIITEVLIRNKSNTSIHILRKLRLKNILEMNYENCFQIIIESKFALTKIIINSSINLSLNQSTLLLAEETKLLNEVIIFENT